MARGGLEGGLGAGVALGVGGVVDVADGTVVADLTAGDGDQMEARIGHVEQKDARDHLAGLLVDLAVGSALLHDVISSIEADR